MALNWKAIPETIEVHYGCDWVCSLTSSEPYPPGTKAWAEFGRNTDVTTDAVIDISGGQGVASFRMPPETVDTLPHGCPFVIFIQVGVDGPVFPWFTGEVVRPRRRFSDVA